MTDDKPLLGDPESNAEFDAGVDAILAKAGVKPLSNPDRVKTPSTEESKASHEAAQRATGSPTGRTSAYLPSYPGRKDYDTEIMSQMITRSTFPWIGVLGSAQAAGHEVSVHLRQDPVPGFRGRIVNEPPLTDLDELAAASVKTVKLERDTGSAPRREVTTVLIADIVAITVIEKKS
jgi:hypothetical protein